MRKILSVIISLCLIFPVCNVQAFRLEPFYMGMVAKHVPESDKQKFEQVSKNCATAIDCGGYVDRYLELCKLVKPNNKQPYYGREPYEIKTPDAFLKIYELLHNTQFKVLRTKRTPFHDFIYTNHPSDHFDNYVLFPMNYDNHQESDDDDCKRHLKNLRKFESEITLKEPEIINDHCIRPELFFQICFDINDQMYPDCCFDINEKNEFRTKLQDFLIKQTISWASSVGYTKIRQIPDPNSFLDLHELDYLRHNLKYRMYVGGASLIYEYASLKPAFVTTPNPDSVFQQEVYDFNTQNVIDGLWRQGKLTRNFSYVADINGRKLRILPNNDGNIDDPKLHSVFSTPGLRKWRTHKTYHEPFLSNGPYYHPLMRMCDPLNLTLDWLCGLEFDSFKKDFNEFVCNCDIYKLRKPRQNLLNLFEHLLHIDSHDWQLPDKLDYLSEVLFEDEQSRSCVQYDGILNLLYIFDFFEFPKNVTDQIIKYVFGEMIRRCPSIHDLYATAKFEQVVKLSQKLWSINNNEIFLNLKDTLISRIMGTRRLNTLESKISELDSYTDFISYMADKLDISTSEKEIILQSMRETLQKSFSQTIKLKKQEQASSYAQLNTEDETKQTQTNCVSTSPTELEKVNDETTISSYTQVSNGQKPKNSDSNCVSTSPTELEKVNDEIPISSDDQPTTAQSPNPPQSVYVETNPTELSTVNDETAISSYTQVSNGQEPKNSDSNCVSTSPTELEKVNDETTISSHEQVNTEPAIYNSVYACGLTKSIDLENENDAILVSSDTQPNTAQLPNPSQNDCVETNHTELEKVNDEIPISSDDRPTTAQSPNPSQNGCVETNHTELEKVNDEIPISSDDQPTTAKDPNPSQPNCDKTNFNKYIGSSRRSIGLGSITAETNGNYYENLPSDSELNTTNKTTSTTTSTELGNKAPIVTPKNAFVVATTVGVLNAIIPKLYRKIVKFRKTSKAIKKLKTLNNVINLAS